jgi:hypothetical protein
MGTWFGEGKPGRFPRGLRRRDWGVEVDPWKRKAVRHNRPTEVVLERTARNPFVRRLPRGVDPETGQRATRTPSPPRRRVDMVVSSAPAPKGAETAVYEVPADSLAPATEPRRRLVSVLVLYG